jgi:cellulose synthase/poly-beta-1,6-N-acetylglucosamine synthase-like glycosyltransferase
MLIANICLWCIAGAVALPLVVLCIECLAALLLPARGKGADKHKDRPAVAVVIPAHNEQAVIGSTLDTLKHALRAGDRVIVVGDNCADATADEARQRGATVVERNDREKCGKGFALQAGVLHLQDDAPEIVVFLDADCHVQADAINHLAIIVATTNRPAQGLYLMQAPEGQRGRSLISLLAFIVKNQVRPAGLDRLGLPVLITGSGFAIPWAVLESISLASADIVEDMSLGLNLIESGHGPVYCPQARITGVLPQSDQAATSQRTRWEHGHLSVLLSRLPLLLLKGLATMRMTLIATAFDLLVPPLSLLILGAGAVTFVCVLSALMGLSWQPLVLLGVIIAATAVTLLGVWYKYARDQIAFRDLLCIPLYMLWKVPIYVRFITHRQESWVRTQRDAGDAHIHKADTGRGT